MEHQGTRTWSSQPSDSGYALLSRLGIMIGIAGERLGRIRYQPRRTLQAKLDYVANGIWRDTTDGTNPGGPDYSLPTPFDFAGTYTLGAAVGSASVEFVPEPGTLALLGMSGLGLLAYAWRRRRS